MVAEPGSDVGAHVTGLLDDLASAKAALEQAERVATDELIAAKAAHRDDPNPDTRARKAVAVANIQALRAAVRADRDQQPGGRIGGDAFLSPVQSDGNDPDETRVG